MSDISVKLFGAAILAVLCIVIIRKQSPDTALTLRLVVTVGLAGACIAAISPIVEYVKEISESLGNSEKIATAALVLLKALGISLLTHVTANICRDSGEGSIAYYVELGGKAEILLLSLPLLREVIDMTLTLFEMS